MHVYAADDARRGPQRTVHLRQREEVETCHGAAHLDARSDSGAL
jgi:hypothetical protein